MAKKLMMITGQVLLQPILRVKLIIKTESQKVRDVVLCGECSKPRCIYSNKKLTTEQVCTIVNY